MSACNSVIASEVDKFLNVLGADVVASAENNGVNRTLCPKLQAFPSVKSGNNIASDSERTVIFKKHNVVLLQIRLNSIRNFNS